MLYQFWCQVKVVATWAKMSESKTDTKTQDTTSVESKTINLTCASTVDTDDLIKLGTQFLKDLKALDLKSATVLRSFLYGDEPASDPFRDLIKSLFDAFVVAVKTHNLDGAHSVLDRMLTEAKGRDDSWLLGLFECVAAISSESAYHINDPMPQQDEPTNVNCCININPMYRNSKAILYTFADRANDFVYRTLRARCNAAQTPGV